MWRAHEDSFSCIDLYELNQLVIALLKSYNPDSMYTCSKFDFLWILSRYDKFVMSNLWQNSCKANGIISDHSLAKQVCSKTMAILSESACVTMVTSALALTCCKLIMNSQTCHVELAELAASLQTCNARFAASLLQVKIAIWVRTQIIC